MSKGEMSPAVYTRGGLGRGDYVPGLSDIDVIVVVVGDPDRPCAAADRVRRRWTARVARWPFLDAIFGEPRILEEYELRLVTDRSLLTFDHARPAFGETGVGRDSLRMLERPGLEGTADWVRLAGPERRPPRQPSPTPDLGAAWLELAFYWRHALVASADPTRPRVGLLCIKLVAEPVRILLALAGVDATGPRHEVLRRGIAVLPDEEPALRWALGSEHDLHRRDSAPFDVSLATLIRLSDRIARTVNERSFSTQPTTVRLLGGSTGERLPLCDWRAIVQPALGPETFALDSTPLDAAVVGAASRSQCGSHYASLRSDALLVLPTARRERATLRAVACRTTDPVSHALLEGEESASFPQAPGWTIEDIARRAMVEHSSALIRGASAADDLLAAARAALLRESIRDGAAALALTHEATLEQLRPHAGSTIVDELSGTLAAPSAKSVAALATAVRKLFGSLEPRG